jgi:uncharacterized protein (UPF0248 family)
MLPIQDLLHRIRWDPEFGRGRFELAYLDKVTDRLERVPLEAVHFEPGERFGFELIGGRGEERFIPYHRVREVYCDGRLIWKRPGPES